MQKIEQKKKEKDKGKKENKENVIESRVDVEMIQGDLVNASCQNFKHCF